MRARRVVAPSPSRMVLVGMKWCGRVMGPALALLLGGAPHVALHAEPPAARQSAPQALIAAPINARARSWRADSLDVSRRFGTIDESWRLDGPNLRSWSGGPGRWLQREAEARGAGRELDAPIRTLVGGLAQGAPRTAWLIVAGVGGEKRLSEAFHGYATTVATAAQQRFGAPDSLVVILAEDSTRARVRARSTREQILSHIARLSRGLGRGDRLVIILFGHGTSQGEEARFNVPGPDISVADFAGALAGVRDPSVVLVNTTSASGAFVKGLAATNRTIITATRSSREQNETLFPSHFVAALTAAAADTDKDGRVNLLEAFTYARLEVARVFEQGNRLVTEHALLDDDGDGEGHSDASEKGPDGPRARAIFFEPAGGTTVASDPRAATLLAERREIEGRIEALRGRRAGMSEDDYQKALEPLLLQLAEKTRALRALEGKKP